MADLDAFVDAFEESPAARGPDALRRFLPAADHPMYVEIASELVRIDLERGYTAGGRPELDDYRPVAPGLFADREALSGVAFEEYRQRRRVGLTIHPGEYDRRYGVDSSRWPRIGPSESAPPTPSPGLDQAPQPGDGFGPFELCERLGRGAFGVVYLARQSDLASREVVLKITPRRSFEAQRLARLQHTNITPVYSTHEEGPWLGICMPFLGRRTLADLLGAGTPAATPSTLVDRGDAPTQRAPLGQPPVAAPGRAEEDAPRGPQPSGPMSERAAAGLVAAVAEGLAHAHARGIVHSDLKPANVLLGDDGAPRLLDFNLSADTRDDDPGTLMVGGTLPYLAPEHLAALERGAPVEPASDVFSLGVILHELLCGRRPFPAPAQDGAPPRLAELAAERRACDPGRLAQTTGASPAMQAVLAKALHPDPAGRYGSAAALAQDLRLHLENKPLRHAPEPWGAQRLAKWGARNAGALRVAGVGLLALALAGALWGAATRDARLKRADATAAWGGFQQDAQRALLNLHTPGSQPELWALGAQAAHDALASFEGPNAKRLDRLTPRDAQAARGRMRQLRSMLAELDRRTSDKNHAGPLGLAPDAGSDDPVLAAAALLGQGSADQATARLRGAPSDARRDPVWWLLLGNAEVAQGRLADAESCYTGLIALQPDAMVGHYYRALARMQAGRLLQAEEDLTDAIHQAPEAACLLLNRALARRQMRAWGRAEEDVTAALAIDPEEPRAWFLRSELRNAQGDAAGAEADRAAGLRLTPRDDLGWAARGLALLPESPERALEALREGLARYPASPSLLQNSVHVLADRLGRSGEAFAYASQLVEARPADDAARLTRAVLLARRGERAEALADAKRVDPRRATPLVALQAACVYSLTSELDAGHPQDVTTGVAWLQRALRGEPQLGFRVERDPDLEALRRAPACRELLDSASRLVQPVRG